MQLETIIHGATVVTGNDTRIADIGIRDGRIVALAENLDFPAAERINATGLIAMPGGIDSHVHISQPSGPAVVMADDFDSATRSAAFGGNTTVMPFCLPVGDQSLREAVAEYVALAEGNCHVDAAIHLIVHRTDPATLGQDLPALHAAGFTSFKVFMTYEDLVLTDREILDVLEVAKSLGAAVMVHAENEDAVNYLRDKAAAEGRSEPVMHARTRPVPAEREATHRALSLAQIADVPITIVHVSNGEALDEIRRARQRGQVVHAETCPQYLTLTEDDLDQTGFEGAKFVCSPPPRDTAAQKECWQGIELGDFDLFSSDHCPFRFADPQGKEAPGARDSFRNIPNGIPGVETRLPILFSEGVMKGRITLQHFARITATNHARLYGLAPAKGSIAIGADADIVLWDPTVTRTISQTGLHHGADYTPWEGFSVTGWPIASFLRGKPLLQDGEINSHQGRVLECGQPDQKAFV